MWFWFKNDKEYHSVRMKINSYNRENGQEFWIKHGFMDYWK